jgi:hypothetical protein
MRKLEGKIKNFKKILKLKSMSMTLLLPPINK